MKDKIEVMTKIIILAKQEVIAMSIDKDRISFSFSFFYGSKDSIFYSNILKSSIVAPRLYFAGLIFSPLMFFFFLLQV